MHRSDVPTRTGLQQAGLQQTGLQQTGLQQTGLQQTGQQQTGLPPPTARSGSPDPAPPRLNVSIGAALAVATALTAAAPANAEGERAGDFAYYVMALTWSPTWCLLDGDARGDDQCDPRHDYSFTLHGLWPQDDSGYPSYCRTDARDPARADTAAMADIMGSGGLAWYEWKKHGRCSGLSARDYFAASRRAYGKVTIPPVLRALDRDVRLPASVVEEALIEANPDLAPSMITITCDQGMIAEARICLTMELEPRACGVDAARDCRMTDALLPAVR